MPYSIGVDFGTNSARSLIVCTQTGKEIATAVCPYPSGHEGILLDPKDPHLARQNPADYITSFCAVVKQAVEIACKDKSFDKKQIVGIGIDTTGSTPIPVDRDGVPLAFDKKFANDLAAQAWLWKDHTSFAEADEITAKAAKWKDKYLTKCGGTYSSEWYWAKILHCKRVAPDVFKAAYSWVELADFVPGWITDNHKPETMPRGICAAGHKAMFHPDWGGLPSKEFLATLDADLVPLRDHYAAEAQSSVAPAGKLSAAIAEKVGLPAGITVAVGAFDAHMGAVGAGIKPGVLVKAMGTSTCDTMVVPLEKHLADIPGLCGIVPGSITPGMYGLEAGQSAVGDLFNWLVKHLAPRTNGQDSGQLHRELTEQAAKLAPGESGLVALDWNNGNRTILVDHQLAGLLVGQTLHTTAAEIYRALIEATAFGALTIIRRIEEYGVKVEQIICCGGIAEKNEFAMQIYADVCNREIRISRSGQTCSLGAAIFGAVAGGAHKDVASAQACMTATKPRAFTPNPKSAAIYAELYQIYHKLHDAFGVSAGGGQMYPIMKQLIDIRRRAKAGV